MSKPDRGVRLTFDPNEAEVVICLRDDDVAPFGDNLRGRCHDCGRGVQFRPDVPARLVRLCIPCATARMAGSRA